MSSKHASEKQHHGYRRYRALARSLCARIFVTIEGRLLLVGGAPDFERFLACLTRRHEVPESGQSPTPSDLGFPAFCDGELTLHGLQVRSHALTKWSRALDAELRGGAPNRSRAQQISIERDEIAQLQVRLAELYHWLRDIGSGHPPKGMPYLLESRDEQMLCDALAEIEGERRLSPLARWMARIVMWTSRSTTLVRYLNSLTPLLRPKAELVQVIQIDNFRQQLYIWKRRCVQESQRAMQSELRQGIGNLPPKLVTDGKFGARLHGRTFSEHCDILIERCHELLKQLREIPARHVPASMAALAVCDGGSTPLPTRLVRECLVTGNLETLRRQVDSLHEEAGKPAYDDLLLAIESLLKSPEIYEYEAIRIMVLTGTTLEEIAWAQQNNLVDWFDRRRLTVRWLRPFLAQVRQCGVLLEDQALSTMLESIQGKRDIAVLNQWLHWLNLFSQTTVTPKNGKLITKGLTDLIVPGISKLACHDRLKSWANAAMRLRYPIDQAASRVPVLHKWLRRISSYQQLAGMTANLPKSVRKHLDTLNRQTRERAYLQEAVLKGIADQGQTDRLQYLDQLITSPSKVSTARLRRTVEEAFLVSASDALRVILGEAAEEIWRERLGTPIPSGSLNRQISFADWVRRMDDNELKLLSQILQAWNENGVAYQQQLRANHPWLGKATSRHLNVQNWLRPEPASTCIAGTSLRISVAHDPIEVFLMGSYFKTCLTQGGCNEMSVLANAHDANKQVVYMHDSQGRVQARQLVAVSQEFQLLGYHCYTGVNHSDQELGSKYIAAMASYCGHWARRCGISLADNGMPTDIADHFWYDDGTWQWHQSAHAAWSDKDRRPRSMLNGLPTVQNVETPVLV